MDWRGFGVVLLFLLVVLEKVAGLARNIRRDPERRRVSFETESTSREQFDELKVKVAANETRAEARMESFRTEVKADIGELHNKINEVGKDLSGVAAQCEMIGSNLALLSTEVRRNK